jgi:hypothetical protein
MSAPRRAAPHTKRVANHRGISEYYFAPMREHKIAALRIALKKKPSWSRKLACLLDRA